ncbi:DNA cross-link repair protein SNM1 [Chionoecetes opilio]|uniref:DNA cross-link repair protein SNM1 n=1 Tax=Chionoecetes opilio TaxID=41210 RepID=A0A8J5CWQ2_CHIOP|nr:DNA cross-link repair protein SNM1 [Chionoecetes opilio]
MFLFKVRGGATHLHVGDFRAHPSMESYPALLCPIDTLFLDTTKREGVQSHSVKLNCSIWVKNNKKQALNCISDKEILARLTNSQTSIPYSEHSNFNELRRFVQFIKPKKIIPTVHNGNPASRKQMQQHFSKWLNT